VLLPGDTQLITAMPTDQTDLGGFFDRHVDDFSYDTRRPRLVRETAARFIGQDDYFFVLTPGYFILDQAVVVSIN
jgi:hypothetical protein